MSSSPDLVGEREAAVILAVAARTLSHWRWARRGPPWRKVGGCVRYDRRDLESFLEQARRDPQALRDPKADRGAAA